MKVNTIDYLVFFIFILGIVFYGIWKTKKQNSIDAYLRDKKSAPWWVVGLSMAATQASAITFLSTPGQGFSDGFKFIQFYIGMPLAVTFIAFYVAPKYIGANIYTAYEYLESCFDVKTRQLTAFFFLLQRSLGSGLTIYAPAIVFSTALSIDLDSVILVLGSLVVLYTMCGGTRAVNQTQMLQLGVIFFGMFYVFFGLLGNLPSQVNISQLPSLIELFEKDEFIVTELDFTSRYTIWSGLFGGFFLSLAYFGTDQSQVQKFLSAKSVKDSRYGLIGNGLLKIPMQLFILSIGVLLFVFFQFNQAPIFFNETGLKQLRATAGVSSLEDLENRYEQVHSKKSELLITYLDSDKRQSESLVDQIRAELASEAHIRDELRELVSLHLPAVETNDKDFIFVSYIINYLPHGIIGLLFAAFACASMSSTAGELNALATTSLIDFYKRSFRKEADEKHYLFIAKVITFFWGLAAVSFALIVSLFENLIQAVNIIGSLFYGTILGVFVVSFLLKKVSSNAVFSAAIFAEVIVILMYFKLDIGFMWYNVIGTMLVLSLTWALDRVIRLL